MAQRPQLTPCPFCRLEFGSASLPIHVKRCRARPPGAVAPVTSARASRLLRPRSVMGVHEQYADNADAVAPAHLEFVPCRHCSRTFVPDRLRAHEAVCRGRPRTSGENADLTKAGIPSPSKWRQSDELRRSLSTARDTLAIDAAVAAAKARSSSTSARRPPRRDQWGSSGLEGGSAERKRPPARTYEPEDAVGWIGGAASATRIAVAAAVVQPRPGTAGRRMTAARRHALEFREIEQQRQQQHDQVHVPSRLLRSLPSPSPSPLELRRAAALCPPPPPPPPPPPQVDSAGRCLHFARSSAACGAFAVSQPMGLPSPFPDDASSRAGRSLGAWPGSVRRPASAGRRPAGPLR